MAAHLHSIYDVLQLLQGQGLETKSVPQDLFGSIALLLGSISLAVMFGHVAILIANFSANDTAYQRKIERVFAIMDKLELPQAIRDRVRQYYGYLHVEYESLDGDVVQFARDLTHTLELEVVLYKYMDVVINVPHWSECSPDFQKQLVLNVKMRVYLPDDYIFRRGEVGTACFIVNRGVCKQYQFAGANDEVPAVPVPSRDANVVESSRAKRAFEWKYLVRDELLSVDSPRLTDFCATYVTPGHAIGERALIDNYVRTTDVRASSYVEMCVLEREPFQRMLTRYPEDRERVLASIVRQWLYHQGADSLVMETVRHVVPMATFDDAVALVVDTMTPQLRDPTILFGGTDQLDKRLRGRSDEMAKLRAQLSRIERALETRNGGHSQSPEVAAPTHGGNNEPRSSVSIATRVGESTTAFSPLRLRRQSRARRRSDSVLDVPVFATHTPYADRLFRMHAGRTALASRPMNR